MTLKEVLAYKTSGFIVGNSHGGSSRFAQLGGDSPAQVEKPDTISDVAFPTMPVRLQDVPKFELQVEGYVNDLAAERAKQMEQAESGK